MENNEYVCSGLDAVNLKIVRDVDEYNSNKNTFKPEMCHQVFGQSESIYGYENLKIQLVYDASHFRCYVSSSYDFKAQPNPISGLEPEDYLKKLDPWLPGNYCTKESEFLKNLKEAQNPDPKGQLVTSFKQPSGREFQVRVTDSNDTDYNEFHERMETLIVWFIDAASFIDMDDKKWRFFILYEKVTKNGKVFHYPIGYSTVYEYYAFPDRRRYRISQFIVFPPYQHLGLGTEMLKGVYKHLKSLSNILDITVEDPSEKFQALRDFVDVKLCQSLPAFSEEFLKKDFTKNMVTDARVTYKLTEKQIRRVYEILKLSVAKNDEDVESFKRVVMNRLSIPFKKQERNNKRQKLAHGGKLQMDESFHVDHQANTLEKEYQKLLSQYRHVLYRLQINQQVGKVCTYNPESDSFE